MLSAGGNLPPLRATHSDSPHFPRHEGAEDCANQIPQQTRDRSMLKPRDLDANCPRGQPRLLFDAAHVDALGEVLLNEGVDHQDGHDGADDQGVDDGVRRVDLVPASHGLGIGELLQAQTDEDLQGMLVGIGDHLAGPEVTIPAGDGEEQRHRGDGGLTHGDVHLGQHLELGRAVHDGGLFDFTGHTLKGIAQQDDVHRRHTHGDDDQPLVVGDANGVEDILGGQVVQVLGHDAGGEPHGEHQVEVEHLAEQQPLLGQGVGTQDGHHQGPHRAVEGQEQGVGVGVPEHVVIEHAGKSLELDVLGEEHDLAVIHRVGAADGSGDRVEEGIQTG